MVRYILFLPSLFFFHISGNLKAQSPQGADSVASSITFRIRNAEIIANGKFERIQSNIHFDFNNAAKIRFSSIIYVNSIKTGIRLRDAHLKRPLYFDANQYPTIHLNLVSARLISGGKYEGVFLVKMKNIEKRITLLFYMKEERESLVFEAQFPINRRDFHVGGRSWTLAEIADVHVRFVLPKN